jgi:hypothetical protein
MRSNFGGSDTGALAIQAPSGFSGVVKSAPNITTGTAWSAATGGTQYTDMVLVGGGPSTVVLTDANGFVSAFQGPDGVNEGLWVDLGSGRFYLRTTDSLTAVAATDAAAQIAAQATLDSATYGRVAQHLAPLKTALNTGTQSCAVQVLGDSTGVGTYSWPYLLAAGISTDYPAWTVDYKPWNDTLQSYDPATRIQTGTAGERYMDLSAGTYGRRLPLGSVPALTGIIDVRVKISAATWTPAATVNLVNKSQSPPNWSWAFSLATSAQLMFTISTDGSALTTITQFAFVTLPLNTPGWVRVKFNPNDGAGNRVTTFYQSTDGITWTTLGTNTTAGAVTLFDATIANYWLGGGASSAAATATKIYEVQVRDGDTGKCVTPCKPDLWSRYGVSTDCPVVGAPVLTMLSGSMSGAGITYLGDATRLPKMTPDYGQVLTLLSDGHNETWAQGAYWQSIYAAWVTAVKARLPVAPAVGIAQNPERTATMYWSEDASRRLGLLAFARALGIGVIDVFKAFTDYGNWQVDLMNDDIHPNAALGYPLWTTTIKNLLDKSV